LAIALGVARAHGGRIDVSSVLGEGSLFVIVLPVEPLGGQDD
jgi:two-component system sensor histidine kinase FlrB